MLRLAGFFVSILVLCAILRQVPIVGALFRIPFVGFWISALIVSGLVAWLASSAIDRGRRAALVRQLGAVDTPHNRGKLGSLFASQRRWRRALPHLEAAVAGEPDVAEWSYRFGRALLGSGLPDEARVALERTVEIDEEHAYGDALLRLAEAQHEGGHPEGALETLERFERNHGPRPESAYRRGRALKVLGRKSEARAAFEEVGDLASQSARYQRKVGTGWALRAFWARLR